MAAALERHLIVALIAGNCTLTAATFSDQRVTTQAPPASICSLPPAATSLLTSQGKVYLYFDATEATSDSLYNDWLAPDRTVIAAIPGPLTRVNSASTTPPT
jgi:hypothetical protein